MKLPKICQVFCFPVQGTECTLCDLKAGKMFNPSVLPTKFKLQNLKRDPKAGFARSAEWMVRKVECLYR